MTQPFKSLSNQPRLKLLLLLLASAIFIMLALNVHRLSEETKPLAVDQPPSETPSAEMIATEIATEIPTEAPTEIPTRCARPIHLKIGTVDPEFNLGHAALTQALNAAITEWNLASGYQLFKLDSINPIAVNFLFDGRQSEINDQLAAEREIEQAIAVLNAEQKQRDDESVQIERLVASAQTERANYESMVTNYNAIIAEAQSRGALDEEQIRAFAAQNQELSMRRNQLERSASEIKAIIDEYNRKAKLTEKNGNELRAKIADLKERFPPRTIREAEHRKGALINEVNVYTFASMQDLHFTLLHELGHVLGLSHAQVPNAIMSPVRELGSPSFHLTQSDITAARELCSASLSPKICNQSLCGSPT